MISTQVTLITATMASFGMAAIEGVQAVQHTLTGAAITGHGSVSGEASPGERVVVRWVIHKRVDCPGWNSRVWDGPDGFKLTEERMATTLPISEKPKVYDIETKIPELAPPGDLELRIVGEYQCKVGGTHEFALGPVDIRIR